MENQDNVFQYEYVERKTYIFKKPTKLSYFVLLSCSSSKSVYLLSSPVSAKRDSKQPDESKYKARQGRQAIKRVVLGEVEMARGQLEMISTTSEGHILQQPDTFFQWCVPAKVH